VNRSAQNETTPVRRLRWLCATTLIAGCLNPTFAADGAPGQGSDDSTATPQLAAIDPPPDYPLDAFSRAVIPGERLPCERGELPLESYRGELVRYQKPVRIHPAFRSHLIAFERLVAELGALHLGRAPRRILHFGAYVCRPMRIRTHWVSEHAFGNAIDVAGFEFPPLPAKARRGSTLPRALWRGFTVRVDTHWDASGGTTPEAAFLRALADAVIERPGMFRAFIGPGYANHDNHFHFANPPYRLVKVGDVQRWFW
jgi:hypothetical protein